MAVAGLVVLHRVGQFIATIRVRREMKGQKVAGFLDSMNDARREFGVLKMFRHFAG